MNNRLPHFKDKHKLCIICEGNEEYLYLERLKNLDVWNDIYDINLVNAQGNGNITARYQDKYQNGSYEIILIFCDTEKKPYKYYYDIKRKINEFHGVEDVADDIVIYANPCTMQVVIKHFVNFVIEKAYKAKNADIIEKCTGIKGYKAKKEQIESFMEKIDTNNYETMKSYTKDIIDDETKCGSTNFIKFITWLESYDVSWIDEINGKIDSVI